MRLLSARWIGLLLLAVGVTAAVTQARESEGRWKIGDGVCYFDATDSGFDQCTPEPGRWKLGGDGSCYFDAADDGPDQCVVATSSLAEGVVDDVSARVMEQPVTPGAGQSGAGTSQPHADPAR